MARCAKQKLAAVLCVVITFSISAHSKRSRGAETRPEALKGGDVAILLGWAAKLGGYMRPTGRPHVYPITHYEIRRDICMNFNCSAVAFFNPANDAIYVDERLLLTEDVVAQSFLVHEMVHYLQHLTGKIGDSAALETCEQRMMLEMEAYRVQNRFLAAMGSMERIMGGALLARLC
jgi:hypothetical protein